VNEDSTEETAIGKIASYHRVLNPFKRQIKVCIKTDNKTIAVLVEDKELKFIQKKYWTGGRVALGFYGNQWHVGIPPSPAKLEGFVPEKENEDLDDLFDHEIGDINIKELVGKPDKNKEIGSGIANIRPIEHLSWSVADVIKIKAPDQNVIDSSPVNIYENASWVASKQDISLEDALIEDIDKFGGYLKWVEEYTREGVDEMLDKLELSHLNVKKDNVNINFNDHVRKNEEKTRLDEYIEMLGILMNQNDEILFNQHEIIRLLSKLTSMDEDDQPCMKIKKIEVDQI
jgi:hypothetical protein